MIYYSGSYKRLIDKPHWDMGWMLQPKDGNLPRENIKYAIDNGGFKGFDEIKWLKMIDRIIKTNIKPQFIVAPDIIAGGLASAELSYQYIDYLNSLGFKKYFVIQDGMNLDFLKGIQKDWDGFFIGGTTDFKLNMLPIIKFNFSYKPCHVGRVNTVGRYKLCELFNYDSCDGSNLTRFGRWDISGRQLEDYIRADHKQLKLKL